MTLRKRKRTQERDSVNYCGLRKADRLKDSQVIRRFFTEGKRFRRGSLTIISLPSDEQLAGFVASKQIGGAVRRNKVKRILREAYRMNRAYFKGSKVIFYAHGPLSLDEVIAVFDQFKERG